MDNFNEINGTERNDFYSGTEGADLINGAGGDDILFGKGGDDHIIGGPGIDWLVGGSGADTFIYNSVSESPYVVGKDDGDRITDFNRLEGDKIDLSSIDADRTLDGNQAFAPSQMSYDSTGYFTANVLGGADLEIKLSGNTVFDPARDVITAPLVINLGISKNILDAIIEISTIGKFVPDIPLPGPICLSCPSADSNFDLRPNPQPSINFLDAISANASQEVQLVGNVPQINVFEAIL
jgi:RTX calcium-binding nonapeptide repeat (4 copies)